MKTEDIKAMALALQQVNELSNKTLKNYQDKAENGIVGTSAGRKTNNRINGSVLAQKKRLDPKKDTETQVQEAESLGHANSTKVERDRRRAGKSNPKSPTLYRHDQDGKSHSTPAVKSKKAAGVARRLARANEEVEELDELSKKTLGSYVKKASIERDKKGDRYSILRHRLSDRKGEFADDTPNMKKIGRKAVNRDNGVELAKKKLAKEGVEITESSYTIHHHKTGEQVAKFDLSPGTKNDAIKKAGVGKFFVKNADGQVVSAYKHAGDLKGEDLPRHQFFKFNDPKPKKESFVDRYLDKVVNEELEMFSELSKKTLGSYVKKASDVVARNSAEYNSVHSGEQSNRGTFKDRLDQKKWLHKDTAKRKTGMDRALGKLTKEEVERIEELSKKTLGRYVKGASDDVTDRGHALGKKNGSLDNNSSDMKKINSRHKGISKAVSKLTKEDLDEGYKENENRWVDQVSSVASEIESMAKNLVAAHEAACAAQERISASYAKGETPSEADRKAADQKLYDVKYLARQLEDVRDALENKHPSPTVADTAYATPKRYYESVQPTKEEPMSIRSALAMMEDRQSETRGPSQPADLDFSGATKAFIATHAVQTPDESNIDAATAKNKAEVEKSLQRTVNYRHNDQKTGDK